MATDTYGENYSKILNTNRTLTKRRRIWNTICYSSSLLVISLWCTVLFFYSFIRYNTYSAAQLNNFSVLFDFTMLPHNVIQLVDNSQEYYMLAMNWHDPVQRMMIKAGYSPYQHFSDEKNNSLEHLISHKIRHTLAEMAEFLSDMFTYISLHTKSDIGALFYSKAEGKWDFSTFSKMDQTSKVIETASLTLFTSFYNILYQYTQLLPKMEELIDMIETHPNETEKIAILRNYIYNSAKETNTLIYGGACDNLRQLIDEIRDIVVDKRYDSLSSELYTSHLVIGCLAAVGILYSIFAVFKFRERLVLIFKGYTFLKKFEIEFMVEKMTRVRESVFESNMFNERVLIESYFAAWKSHPRVSFDTFASNSAKPVLAKKTISRYRERVFRNRRVPTGCKWIIWVIILIVLTFSLSLMLTIIGLEEQKKIGKVATLYVELESSLVESNLVYMQASLYSRYYFGYEDEKIKLGLIKASNQMKRSIIEGRNIHKKLLGEKASNTIYELFTGNICNFPEEAVQKDGFDDSFCQTSIMKSSLKGSIGIVAYQEFFHSNILKPIVEEYNNDHSFILTSESSKDSYLPIELFMNTHLIEFRLARKKMIEIFQNSFYHLLKGWLFETVAEVDKNLTIMILITVCMMFLVSLPTFFFCAYSMYFDLRAALFAYEVVDIHIVVSNPGISNEIKRQFDKLA